MSSDPALKNLVKVNDTPAPVEIKTDEVHMKRVARPLRHVKNIPTKQLVFYSKYKEPQFTYDLPIKLPIPARAIVVQVRAAPLNPLDLKIINSYTSNMNSERGIGREYAGVITNIGSKVTGDWKEGDEVCGLYIHPNSFGTLCSSIVIYPSEDAIVHKPKGLSWEEASSWMITFGTAFQALAKCKISKDSNVLINGGSSSVGMMAIQLLKQSYHTENIVAVCSGSAIPLAKQVGAKLCVNYKVNPDVPHVLDVLTTTGVYKDYDDQGNPIEVRDIPGKKFDLILDCVGGYKLVEHCKEYLANGGSYITTVGDYHFNYKSDLYNSWNNVSMGARSWFAGVWNMKYLKLEFNKKPGDWIEVGREMLEAGEITNVIDSTYDWKEYAAAKRKVESGHAHGKVVLKVELF